MTSSGPVPPKKNEQDDFEEKKQIEINTEMPTEMQVSVISTEKNNVHSKIGEQRLGLP